jgi:hypothetical protein
MGKIKTENIKTMPFKRDFITLQNLLYIQINAFFFREIFLTI